MCLYTSTNIWWSIEIDEGKAETCELRHNLKRFKLHFSDIHDFCGEKILRDKLRAELANWETEYFSILSSEETFIERYRRRFASGVLGVQVHATSSFLFATWTSTPLWLDTLFAKRLVVRNLERRSSVRRKVYKKTKFYEKEGIQEEIEILALLNGILRDGKDRNLNEDWFNRCHNDTEKASGIWIHLSSFSSSKNLPTGKPI